MDATTKPTHTSGPWTVDCINYSKKLDVSFEIMSERGLVAQTIMREIATEADRIAVDEANTRLIAASPDLLEALRGILEIGKRDLSNPKYDGYFESARAAIDKAEGR